MVSDQLMCNIKRYITMSEKEYNKRAKCPVCGRFCKQEAVDKYNGLLNERNRLAKELDDIAVELGEVRKALTDAKEFAEKAKNDVQNFEDLYINTRGKYDTAVAEAERLRDKLADAGTKLVSMQSELNDLRTENEKVYNRGLWARIRNKRV